MSHFQEAVCRSFVPVQDEFVVPRRVRLMPGFGGMLDAGDLYVVILFLKVPIESAVARALAIAGRRIGQHGTGEPAFPGRRGPRTGGPVPGACESRARLQPVPGPRRRSRDVFFLT